MIELMQCDWDSVGLGAAAMLVGLQMIEAADLLPVGPGEEKRQMPFAALLQCSFCVRWHFDICAELIADPRSAWSASDSEGRASHETRMMPMP